MKRIILLLTLVPVITFSQSKKQKKAQQKINIAIESSLKESEQYLASDKLEGRRTGSPGELLAMQYLIEQYQKIGIEPKGDSSYVQEFNIDEGKVAIGTSLKVNGTLLELDSDYFPLAYSGNSFVKGTVAPALNERGQPWFIDLSDVLEDNANNPHFDMDEFIKESAGNAIKRKVTALLLYNSSKFNDNILFNKRDTSAALGIPVVYITKDAFKKYFPDVTATFSLEINVAVKQKMRKAHNVVGFINNNAANTVILGAHYDHLGYNEDGYGLDTVHSIHYGADDNGSGVAALIELAKLLKQSSPKNNNYLIINFSGEELGLLGSKYWLEHPTAGIIPNYMINMDMVGRYDTAHKLTIGGYGTTPTWGEIVKSQNKQQLIIKLDSTGTGPSDHDAFYRKNMPVLFFFTGSHPDYHKATDTWDKINYTGEREIVQFIYQIIHDADAKGKLTFTKTNDPQMGRSTKFTVSLGFMPDYGYTGTGVRIDGISKGKIAEKIGLQAGDVLLQLGEYKFADVISYMKVLGKFKKGDAAKLRIKRGNDEKEYDVQF